MVARPRPAPFSEDWVGRGSSPVNVLRWLLAEAVVSLASRVGPSLAGVPVVRLEAVPFLPDLSSSKETR